MALELTPNPELNKELQTLAALDQLKGSISLSKNTETQQDIKTLVHDERNYEYYEWLTYHDVIKRYIKRNYDIPWEERAKISKELDSRKFTPKEEKIWLAQLDKEVKEKEEKILGFLDAYSLPSSPVFSSVLNKIETITIVQEWKENITLQAPTDPETDKQMIELKSQRAAATTKEERSKFYQKISNRKKELTRAWVLFYHLKDENLHATACTSDLLMFKANPRKNSKWEIVYFPSAHIKHLTVTVTDK